MKKLGFALITTILSVLLLSACNGAESATSGDKDGKLKVVTTYSVIYDIAKNVGGDAVEVESLAPIGSDPHAYEPLPADVQKTTDADAVFYNGLNLEAGGAWFAKMIETAGKAGEDDPVFLISEGVEPMYLQSGEDKGEEDPHAWLYVLNGIKYAENVKKALIKVDPDNKELYEKNAARLYYTVRKVT